MDAQTGIVQPAKIPGAKLGLIVIVGAVIAGLAMLDWSLEQAEQTEMENSAWRAYSSGLVFLKQGKTPEALEALRRAHALERSNEQYALGLIEGLTAARKISEAEPLLNDVLQDEPNDGRANLIAARLMLKKRDIRDAEAYYHRAIYGDWPNDAAANRISVRMELIQLLESKGKHQEMLAELLPLEEEAAHDEQLQSQLAQLFMIAGAPSHSANLYRRILQHDPNNAAAYAGLGEADLQSGEYHLAHGNFLQAHYREPADAHISSRLDLADTLAALDPTPRRLPTLEKYNRSLRILRLAHDDLQQCLAQQSSENTPEVQATLASSENALSGKPPSQPTNEQAEIILGLAQKVWQARVKACGSATRSDEEALRLIIDKLGQ